MLGMAAGLVIALAATWPLALRGGALYWGDVLLYFLPMLEYIQNEIRVGRIPLWNPYVLNGQPLVGNPQVALFYPTTLALRLLDVDTFLSFTAVFHVWLAWVGTYRYLRLLRLTRVSSVLGACTFAGSSAFLARMQFPTMIQTMAWLPWVLWAARRVAARPDGRRLCALGVVVGLAVLAGHPQMAYVALILAMATALAHAYRRLAPLEYKLRVTYAISTSLGLGAALSCVFWLPVAETVRMSSRQSLSLDMADRFVLMPEHLLSLVWPGYFGDPARGTYWTQGNMWEPALYLGLPQLALAFLAMRRWRTDPRVVYHSLVAGLSLWLALGARGGLYALAYYVIPGMSGFHDPARFCVPASLAVACLSALGLEHASARWPRMRTWGAVAFCVVIALLWTSRLTPVIAASELRYRARLAAIGEGHRVYSPMRQEQWYRYVNYADYGAGTGRYVHELTDTVSPNIGMRYDLEEAGGYEPVPIALATKLEGTVRTAFSSKTPLLEPLLSLADARLVLVPNGYRYVYPCLTPVPILGNRVYRTRTAISRAWFVESVRHIPDTSRALVAMSRAGFSERREAIVHTRSDVVFERSPRGMPERVTVTLSPGTMTLRFAPEPRTRFLVVSSTWMPGWRATANGRSLRVERCNVSLMGVVVPRDVGQVRLAYRPAVFLVGLYVTMCTLMCLLVAAFSRILLAVRTQPTCGVN